MALAATAFTGCGVRSRLVIDGTGSLAETPDGPSAVLRVTVPEEQKSWTGQTTWGKIATPHLARGFAEQLAWTASEGGWMDVVPVQQVAERIEQGGDEADYTLRPDEETLRKYADALGLASYLTAELRCSRLQYRFFWSWALVEYSLACQRATDGQVVWQVDVCRQARYMSDREVTRKALRETFQWLQERFPTDEECGCPE
jgi:hypothetical protein